MRQYDSDKNFKNAYLEEGEIIGVEKGKIIGREEEKVIGERKVEEVRQQAYEEKLASAKSLLDAGMAPKFVAKHMKLPLEVVLNLI